MCSLKNRWMHTWAALLCAGGELCGRQAFGAQEAECHVASYSLFSSIGVHSQSLAPHVGILPWEAAYDCSTVALKMHLMVMQPTLAVCK